MILLLVFAFASGFVTALTPCVLPILPIVLSSTALGGKRRPLGVIVGLVFSFTFFTLFLTFLVKQFNLPADLLRNIAIGVLFFFGLSMVVPQFRKITEQLFSRLSNRVGGKVGNGEGFWSGVVVGMVVGLLWVPCAGPILASVIALAVTSTVTLEAVLITFSYVCGASIVLLLIAYGGKKVVSRFRALNVKSQLIQTVFGFVMILTSLSLLLNLDRQFQIYITTHLPSWALTPLGEFESSDVVASQLRQLRGEGGNSIPVFDKAVLLQNKGVAPEFMNPTAWLNTDGKSLSMQDLRGKVVLVDFWTYSCVNCIRTLPYLKQWNEKYSRNGLVIVGVHAPEFTFERDVKNVSRAVKDFGITYPVVLDNEFATWRAYNNNAWPAKYLIDTNGVVRYSHIGEGRYGDTEKAIQLLLQEKGSAVEYDIATATDVPRIDRSVSPETYMGYARANSNQFRSGETVVPDAFGKYTQASRLDVNQYDLSGEWKITEQYAEAKKGSKLRFRFVGKEMNLVMSTASESATANIFSPASKMVAQAPLNIDALCTDQYCMKSADSVLAVTDIKEGELRVKITVSGSTQGNVNKELIDGEVRVKDAKMYKLVEFDESGEGIVELEFLDDGVRVFAFTFG